MGEGENEKPFDLEERTHLFAKQIRAYYKRLPRTDGNISDGRQLIRSSGSIGANYIEANEAISKKDFLHRLKIARKEAKESRWWLRLLDTQEDAGLERTRAALTQEATELASILSAILRKSE